MAAKVLTGDKALDARLDELKTSVVNRVMGAGIRAGLGEYRKEIRKQVKPSIRSNIRSRFKKKRKGRVEAKVGGGVGRQKANQKQRSKRGVGIDGKNIHWYLLGTAQRTTKSGRSTGRMPAHPAVRIGAARARGNAKTKAVKKMRERLDKEAAKLRKKHQSKG